MNGSNNENLIPQSPVFGIFYPDDLKNSPRVFYQSLKEATKFANSPEIKSRAPRFRRFGNEEEAHNFYDSGDGSSNQEKKVTEENKPTASDPVVAFPSVNRIEMTKLKKIIETDNLSEFLLLVETNPRYLVNVASDTASIVQEGCRFNSLHIAARNGSALVAEHILMFISDIDYLSRLYGTNAQDASMRKENILISYLNTPDKGTGDTPLHIAAKFGHAQVARIIVSYKETDREMRNKNNERSIDVVCSRYNGEGKDKLMKELRSILNSFYVSLYRSSDYSCPPQFILSSSLPQSSIDSSNESFNPYNSPLSPILPSFILTAFAGPFDDEDKAIQFKSKWRRQDIDRKRRDFDKGAEKVGRVMATNEGIDWVESWPFHCEPINIKSRYGLEIVEKHFRSLEDNNELNENEEKYEDANEDFQRESSGSELLSWSEEDSLGSLYKQMESLSMDDKSVLEDNKNENEVEEEEEEGEDDDNDDYYTPPSSPPPLFLYESPTKADSDLYEILSSIPKCDLIDYPFIRRFISSMDHLDNSILCNLQCVPSPRNLENSPHRSRINRNGIRSLRRLLNDLDD